jgi:hypothetical protein
VANSSAAARISGELPKFDVVDAITPVGSAPCAECRDAIVDTYYERNHDVICAPCQRRLATATTAAAPARGVARPATFGLAAAVAGAALYFAMLSIAGTEVGVALVVGFLVGRAVQHGTGGRGGRRYQWLAAGLTYVAIASTYAPFVMKGFDTDAVADLAALLLLSAAAPLLGGATNMLGIAIVSVAVALAWRMNRRVDTAVTGPYRVRPTRQAGGRTS